MFKKLTAFLLILILMPCFSSCSYKKTRYEAEFLELFDTVTKIVAYTDTKEEFTQASQLIYDKLKEYHQLYDIYHSYEGINNIKTINDNAGLGPVQVDRRIIDLLLFSKDVYVKTDGKTNIAFGAVLKLWHDYRTEGIEDFENAKLPPMDQLQAAAKHTDINRILIDQAQSTVFLEDPLMSLDVGAVAKGYATEQVSRIAEQNGFPSGLISVGGNVRALGKKPDGKAWNVGIQNPDRESGETTLQTTYLKDCSLVTSGIYERYYTVEGKNYHHIIDPFTLFPAEYFTSVTIACKDSGMADALSTAIFNMPFEQGQALINSLPDTAALWVFQNGEVRESKGFSDYTKK